MNISRWAVVALLVLAVAPQPASAKMGGFVFINNSKLCAYVTIYHRGSENPTWHVAGGTLQPRYVKAGANFAGTVDWSDVKVRAEVTRHATCNGGTIVDVEATYHDTSTVPHVQRTATLQSDSRFYITIR